MPFDGMMPDLPEDSPPSEPPQGNAGEAVEEADKQFEAWWTFAGNADDHLKRVERVAFVAGFNAALKRVALLEGAMKAQDERERNAAEKIGMVHTCDWPDDVAEEVLMLRAELAREKSRADRAEAEIAWLRHVAAERGQIIDETVAALESGEAN